MECGSRGELDELRKNNLKIMDEELIIDQIEHSLGIYNIRDRKVISKQDTVIASFIVCSCFIEHLCTFRYGNTKPLNWEEFRDFVNEYLNKCDHAKLISLQMALQPKVKSLF
jgi:hypothetical protein